jgi:Domain of unknown function (DUF4345)
MTRLYLNLVAGGVALVSLWYALAPHTALGSLVTLSFDNIDQVHMLRGVMGLYLGMVAFWFVSASRPEYARAAVLSAVFFMSGLALGRIFSMVVDGLPSAFLVGATFVEIAAAAWGVVVLRGPEANGN